jgi:phosphate-selective porin
MCIGRMATAATEDADKDANLVDFDVGGVIMEDFTYLRGISRTDNVAQQWQRRRLTLSAELELGKRVAFEVEGGYGQADAGFQWRDAFVYFDLPKRIEVRIGRMRQNFGLSQSTSVKNLATVERPMATDLLNLPRATGVSLALSAGSARVEVSGFHQRDDEGKRIETVLARAVYEFDDDFYWHVGLSAGTQDYAGAVYRVRSKAETDVIGNLLRTEKITAQDVNYAGFDAAWQFERFSLQGEYIGSEVISPKEGDRRYAGSYVQGSLFLTPDAHDFRDGVAKAVSPVGAAAWELVATYSTLDSLSRADGFVAHTVSAGLNLHLRSELKLMAEINALNIHKGKYAGEEGLAALLRLQYRF